MDAMQSLDGINLGRANIKKAEIYLKASKETALNEADARKLIEGDFGYGLRSFARVRGKWDDYK
jgi:hypothetical protein